MGDPITWYALGRTVDDTESIMEAVDAKILTHNLDPSAHGQTGEVVFEHRTATLLDHLFGSVSLKHLFANKLMMMSCFESVDGWTIFGSFTATILCATLVTNNTPNNAAYAYIGALNPGSVLDFDKNPFFQSSLSISNTTFNHIHFGVGDWAVDNTDDAFGFKIIDNTLYAVVRVNTVEHATEIAGITLTNLNVYRVYKDSTENEVYFYVNGVLKHTESTDIPNGEGIVFVTYYIQTTTNSERSLFISDVLYEQDR